MTSDSQKDQREYGQVNNRIQNLLKLDEDGGAYGPSLRTRLAELERHRSELEVRIERARDRVNAECLDTIEATIRQFSSNLREWLKSAPIEIQKLIFQKCIAQISVDPQKLVAHVYVQTIPSVTPAMQRAFSEVEKKALVVSAECARNRVHT
jgi:hypothetical protein